MTDYPSVLAPNATQLMRDAEQVVAAYMGNLPIEDLRNIRNPSSTREDFLPFLAWEYSMDFWDERWAGILKRNLIWASPPVHEFKGTDGAKRDALKAMGYGDVKFHYFRDEAFIGDDLIHGDQTIGGNGAWFEYWIEIPEPIDAVAAAEIFERMALTAAGRSRLTHIVADISTSLIGDDLLVSEDTTLGAVFKFNGEANVI